MAHGKILLSTKCRLNLLRQVHDQHCVCVCVCVCSLVHSASLWHKTRSMEYSDSKNRTYHHLVMPLARISLTLSRHFSLSFIASGRSLGLHPVSSHNCCMYVRAGHPAFAWPYAGAHRNISLMLRAILNESWRQHPTRHKLYGHLPPITKTI